MLHDCSKGHKNSLRANNNSRIQQITNKNKIRRSTAHPTMYSRYFMYLFNNLLWRSFFLWYFSLWSLKFDVEIEKWSYCCLLFFMATTWSFICTERNCNFSRMENGEICLSKLHLDTLQMKFYFIFVMVFSAKWRNYWLLDGFISRCRRLMIAEEI